MRNISDSYVNVDMRQKCERELTYLRNSQNCFMQYTEMWYSFNLEIAAWTVRWHQYGGKIKGV